MRRWLPLLIIVMSLFTDAFAPKTAAASELAAPSTQSIAINEAFKGYWERNGGLARFGYPITEARMETNSSGHTVLTQWFERTRLELHPNNPAPHKILQGRIGAERLAQIGRTPESGHAIAQVFKDYWNRNGGLAGFGHPISAAVEETNSSGDTVLTQWFERARFEWHADPCNRCGGQVLLGRLGAECYEGRTPPAPPAPPPGPGCQGKEVISDVKDSYRVVIDDCSGRIWMDQANSGQVAREFSFAVPDRDDPAGLGWKRWFFGKEGRLRWDSDKNGEPDTVIAERVNGQEVQLQRGGWYKYTMLADGNGQFALETRP